MMQGVVKVPTQAGKCAVPSELISPEKALVLQEAIQGTALAMISIAFI